MTIFIKLDRLSLVAFTKAIINFMSEKLCSADAVEMGIDKDWLPVYVDLGIML